MSDKYYKCPYCGHESVGHKEPAHGGTFILSEVVTSNGNSEIVSGMPVDVFICANCKNVILNCPSAEKNL